MNKRKTIYISLFLFLSLSITAQESKLNLISRPLQDSILLRWAPINYKTWSLGNRYGYNLVRYTILRDSTVLSNPERLALNTLPVKPLELNKWESLVKSNKYAGIAAQALFGKSFEVDAGKGFNPQNVVYKAKEQQQRFAFALYAADMSPMVAKASGLWLTDKTAKKNEKYLYRVFINLPDSLLAEADTAYTFTGISESQKLPVPVEFTSEFGDKLVKLGWNTLAQNNIYIAWEIERSEDKGKHFKSLSEDVIVPFFEGTGSKNEYTFKFDSLQQNGKEYQYRLRGISSFGERGPWSEIVKGKGIETIKANANIISHQSDKKGVLLQWIFPAEEEGNISGFRILRSDNHSVGFEDVSGRLKPAKRNFLDKKPLGTGYYKVMVYLDTIAQKLSFPYLVQLTDSIPPHKPIGLTGVADSSGIVKLSWQANTDPDIYGYRIFRSASGNDEFTQLTTSPIPDAFYSDTLNKQDLNNAVFYKIMALDHRQNQSEFTEVVRVVKVDLIPPSMPVITQTKAAKEGVFLEWINSTSKDVVKHEVFRKLKSDTTWTKIAEVPLKKKTAKSEYKDIDAPSAHIVKYKVMAVDQRGNSSESSFSVEIKALSSAKNLSLQKLSKQVDYEKGSLVISWEQPPKEVMHYKVYRKTKTEAYALYETLDGNQSSFNDYHLKLGDYCTYRIKVIYKDGSVSGFSKEVEVQF
jgi:fibronectin type 3 domain-containing protein